MKIKREYRCGERLANTGRICGKTFKRRWNLKRHIRLVHQSEGHGTTRFVYLTADSFTTESPRAGPSQHARPTHFAATNSNKDGGGGSLGRPEFIPSPRQGPEPTGDDQQHQGYHDHSHGQDHSVYTQPIPVYSIKRSLAHPRQQKVIS